MDLQEHEAPELLAPAGNWECARAAVANGADAIFFGMPAFNARLRWAAAPPPRTSRRS